MDKHLSEMIKALADGKQLECASSQNGLWHSHDTETMLHKLAASVGGSSESTPILYFRIAPNYIRVNGIRVPQPETDMPSIGTIYYVPSISGLCCSYIELVHRMLEVTKPMLDAGLVHRNKEHAIIHAQALLKASVRKE